jgi:hypothetical protein
MASAPVSSGEVPEASLGLKPRLLDGDWRNDLAGHGISFDAWWTQIYQGSPRGKGIHSWQYGGKGDLQVVQPVLASAQTGVTASLRTKARF